MFTRDEVDLCLLTSVDFKNMCNIPSLLLYVSHGKIGQDYCIKFIIILLHHVSVPSHVYSCCRSMYFDMGHVNKKVWNIVIYVMSSVAGDKGNKFYIIYKIGVL
jgi:hypothetical protein